ncbi:Ig-like domain protein [Magpiepox virus 2]|nr:Ig-like domain protein [Magpiepox virus 2]
MIKEGNEHVRDNSSLSLSNIFTEDTYTEYIIKNVRTLFKIILQINFIFLILLFI